MRTMIEYEQSVAACTERCRKQPSAAPVASQPFSAVGETCSTSMPDNSVDLKTGPPAAGGAPGGGGGGGPSSGGRPKRAKRSGLPAKGVRRTRSRSSAETRKRYFLWVSPRRMLREAVFGKSSSVASSDEAVMVYCVGENE